MSHRIESHSRSGSHSRPAAPPNRTHATTRALPFSTNLFLHNILIYILGRKRLKYNGRVMLIGFDLIRISSLIRKELHRKSLAAIFICWFQVVRAVVFCPPSVDAGVVLHTKQVNSIRLSYSLPFFIQNRSRLVKISCPPACLVSVPILITSLIIIFIKLTYRQRKL